MAIQPFSLQWPVPNQGQNHPQSNSSTKQFSWMVESTIVWIACILGLFSSFDNEIM
jgi:hypothetical protein